MNDLGFKDDAISLNFDFKSFFFRLLSYWKWFLLVLIIALYVVYHQNIRREFPYTLSSQVSVQDDKNPLFTNNTSLIFNYGGISGKVQNVLLELKSRKHHEKVVDSLELFFSYLKQGRFYKADVYGQVPFKFQIDKEAYQAINVLHKITFVSENEFDLEVNFNKDQNTVRAQEYVNKTFNNLPVAEKSIKKRYKIGDYINLPFLKGQLNLLPNRKVIKGQEFFIRFNNFDAIVSRLNSVYTVKNEPGSPLLTLRLTNKNKQKIVDYLNTSISILDKDQLEKKNEYATKTIAFIDKQLSRVKGDLTSKADSLNEFKRANKIFDIDSESKLLSSKKQTFETEKESIEETKVSYNILKNYLLTSNDFTSFPAPALEGVTESNISTNVSKITQLSVEKSNLEYSVKSDATVFVDLNRQIEALKIVLLENIKAVKSNLNFQIKNLNTKIYQLENQFALMPENEQTLQAIERQYLLSQATYNLYLKKRGEADLIKASNVSDILLIEPAKDIGQPRNTVDLNIRYVFGVFAALIPFIALAFIVTFLDKKFHSPEDIESQSKIPLLGVVGKHNEENNLIVLKKPKSPISESFRAIRSNLSFFYNKNKIEGAKTVMLTSSISGEGKTFCSINIASVFALSDKKTVIVGLDLRKPKIFDDFEVNNDVGVVNYLIGDKSLKDITHHTKVENLDLIVSGPIPPNPSELLIGETMVNFITELKKKYDYIVLDTPPVGLVADAFELLKFVDTTVYVVRQNYTEKEMLNLISAKYKAKEIENLSVVYNHYDVKGRYGYVYGYGYGYGYGAYANGYHETNVEKTSVIKSFINRFKTKK
ncbi:polysaccharide biosynthesis tyrosine autokinase [Aurantibacter sp.]|uniref:exopolysaccharide transport family protein n=1 Tax=Aurantibacter sp. TaxID=2807103 RepID=UPI0035C7EEE5